MTKFTSKTQPQVPSPSRASPAQNEIEEFVSQTLELSEMVATEMKNQVEKL